MTTNPDLDQAREWAKSNLDKGYFAYGGRVMAAAHVIASLPDEWIDAEKLRAVLARLDREYFAVADSNPRPGRDEHTTGYLAGIDTAYAWLQKTLEDHHE